MISKLCYVSQTSLPLSCKSTSLVLSERGTCVFVLLRSSAVGDSIVSSPSSATPTFQLVPTISYRKLGHNLSGPYSETIFYRMNASDILNSVSGTLAYYGVDSTIVLNTIARVVFTTVFGFVLKIVLEQASKRYSNRKRNQLNQFYSDVKVFQEILQETEKSVVGTGDNYARQLLEKNLNKCQKVCNQIESQSIAGIFSRSSQQVEELDLLLRNTIHITNTYLSASSAGMKADVRHLRAVVHNLQAGMCQLQVHEALTEPKKVTKLIIEELKPGILHVSWKKTTETDYYEVQYDRQIGHSIKVSSTQCLLDSMQLHFPSEKSYNIRVRGVNGCGPGEWSESAVGKFTILPERPQKPLTVHVNSSTSITLIMEKPVEGEGVKPVTHFVVEYHTDADKRCLKKVFPINNLKVLTLKRKNAVEIKLNDRRINTALTYHVMISHRNEDGDSLPCVDRIEPPPNVPVGLKVAFQKSCGILIEWKETNACTIDHYEVHWELDKETVDTEVTKNCYAVRNHLDSNTSYLIKVRAVNKRFRKSEFTEEIRVKTETDVKISELMVFASIMFISGCTQVYIPLLQPPIFICIVLIIFRINNIKHVWLLHCLLALVITGIAAIAFILDLWYPVKFLETSFKFSRLVLVLSFIIGILHIHAKEMQLIDYMIEKRIASSQLIEQVTQIDYFDLFYIPSFTLILFALLQCGDCFIPKILSMLNY